MKKELLILISRVEYPENLKKISLPLISEQNILNYLLRISQELKPLEIGLLVKRENDFAHLKLRPEPKIFWQNSSGDLGKTLNSQNRGKFQGDLLLLSSDFFPLDSGLLRELIRSHQKSGSLLTLIAKKVRADSRYQSEDYFVLPGLAAISLRKGLGWLKKIRAFKPTGQLDIVALVEASEKSEETPNFLWLQDSGGTEAVWLNEQEDLSLVASILNKRKLAELEKRGVFFLSPNEVWLDPEVEIGPGTVIYPSVVIEGQTKIGKDCLIYPHCHIVNSWIGNRVKVLGATVIEGCRLEAEAQVGPFSRLRPEPRLAAGSRVGNFVEMKKTFFGRGSKAMHLSYLGDATVEEMVNVGAGTITCNYDGQKKNKTYIGKGAFIGSGTELVAPVKIGRGAYIAAGSTITENVSSEALAIARARQVEKPGWVRRRKQKLASTENNQKKKK